MEHTLHNNSTTMRSGLVSGRCDEFSLDKGDVYRFKMGHKPVEVTSLGSALWLTRENDPHDYVIERQESVSLTGPGVVVIEALQGGAMRIKFA